MIANTCCCGGKEKELTVRIRCQGTSRAPTATISGLTYYLTDSDAKEQTIPVIPGQVIKLKAGSTSSDDSRIEINEKTVAEKFGGAVSYSYTVSDYSVTIRGIVNGDLKVAWLDEIK